MRSTEWIWPTPIYCNDRVDEYTKVQKELHSAVKKIKFEMKEEWGKTHYLSDVNFNCNVIEEYNLEYFKKALNTSISEYCNSIGFNSEYTIDEAWFALYKNGNYGPLHDHGIADMSGVYYLQTNGNDGDFYMDCAVPQMGCTTVYEELATYRTYKPEEGKLIIFPGWVKHGVRMNTTNHVRISLSFNIIFNRRNRNQRNAMLTHT